MQAVILAAGKSTRTYPLTLTLPKPLIKIANKTILEHNLDNLSEVINEIIVVVGYKKEMIISYLGKKYKDMPIIYVEQKKQLGTGHALMSVEKHIKGKFLMMAGDDLYSKKDIKKMVRHNYSILTAKTKNWKNFGVIEQKKGILSGFAEKPKKFISDTINTSMYCLERKIFDYLKKIKKTIRNEYELPDAIKLLSKKHDVYCVPSTRWIPIGYPWDIIKADQILRKGKNNIEKSSKIHGGVKNSSIGKNCIIYGTVENSVLFDNVVVGKGSNVKDSVIGNNVSFSGKIISKDSKKRFGCAIGESSVLENCIIKAGVRLNPNSNFKNKIISQDA